MKCDRAGCRRTRGAGPVSTPPVAERYVDGDRNGSPARGAGSAERLTVGERVPFLCECGDATCFTLKRDLYEEVRRQPTHFVVVTGHATPDVESVVEEGRGFEIVEKGQEEALIARATDPRA